MCDGVRCSLLRMKEPTRFPRPGLSGSEFCGCAGWLLAFKLDGVRVMGAGAAAGALWVSGAAAGYKGFWSSCLMGVDVMSTPSAGSSWRNGLVKGRLSLVGVTGSAGSLAVSVLSSSSAMESWCSTMRDSLRTRVAGSGGSVFIGVAAAGVDVAAAGAWEATRGMAAWRGVNASGGSANGCGALIGLTGDGVRSLVNLVAAACDHCCGVTLSAARTAGDMLRASCRCASRISVVLNKPSDDSTGGGVRWCGAVGRWEVGRRAGGAGRWSGQGACWVG